MNIDRYVSALRGSLEASARAGGQEVTEAADRLAVALEPSVRLVALQVLTDAADEITSQLGADPSVEVRLRGGDADLVVVEAPPGHERAAGGAEWALPLPPAPPVPPVGEEPGDGGQTRITLRLPGALKSQVDDAAAAAGVSLNTWLVRAAQSALTPQPPAQPAARSGKRLTGWAR
ncbi:MAG: toxin-antitoxin system HicB family antitoxin [Cellulomonadaceae bacterium]